MLSHFALLVGNAEEVIYKIFFAPIY